MHAYNHVLQAFTLTCMCVLTHTSTHTCTQTDSPLPCFTFAHLLRLAYPLADLVTHLMLKVITVAFSDCTLPERERESKELPSKYYFPNFGHPDLDGIGLLVSVRLSFARSVWEIHQICKFQKTVTSLPLKVLYRDFPQCGVLLSRHSSSAGLLAHRLALVPFKLSGVSHVSCLSGLGVRCWPQGRGTWRLNQVQSYQ